MTSQLRRLQREWNALVPQAQERGLRGVRPVRLYPEGLHERITHRRARLEWLRRELNLSTAFSTPAPAVMAPAHGEFTFGPELECFIPAGKTREQLAAALRAAGLECAAEHYNHTVRRGWKLVQDGSLRDYARGVELVAPILSGDEGFRQLRLACKVLTEFGCTVDRSCGLHVHVGARQESVSFFRSLVTLYARAEGAIDSFVAPSRRAANNGFAQPIRVNYDRLNAAITVDDVARAINQSSGAMNARGGGRYCKLNLQSFWQHGTVEFRQHQGTVDADKAEQWVRFCLRMCMAARNNAQPAETLPGLLATIGATEQETTFIMNRHNYFARRVA